MPFSVTLKYQEIIRYMFTNNITEINGESHKLSLAWKFMFSCIERLDKDKNIRDLFIILIYLVIDDYLVISYQ